MPDKGASGADFCDLDPKQAPVRGVTEWLAERLRTAIVDGLVPTGSLLPATRQLASDLGLSRGVVVEVYRRLGDEGLVGAKPGAGTVVLPSGLTDTGRAPRPERRPERSTPLTLPLLPRRWATQAEFDLSPGVPDLAAFPRGAWLAAERAVLDGATAADLGYGDPRGHHQLRQALAGWLNRTRGLRIGADEVIVVAGVAQSLALLVPLLARRGATAVAVEDPGSRGARDQLSYCGANVVPVAVDGEALVVEELGASGAQAVVVTPAHQFPTGVVLSPRRRRALLEWARDGKLIIEDDYDAEFRYDRAPVPALQASAPALVAYAGSTSKTLVPGLRLGWLVPPTRHYEELVAAKHAADLGSPAVPQLVLSHLLTSGRLERHLRLVRNRQRLRRDALLAAVAEHLPGTTTHGVAAGLHVLVTLPPSQAVDDVELAAAALARGVLVHPLSLHRCAPGQPGLILGYAAHSPDELRCAVQRLGVAHRQLVGSATAP
jgi:GntR family transcriptional regulator/MocR family aminotransferase